MSESDSPRGDKARELATRLEDDGKRELEEAGVSWPLEADEPTLERSHPPATPDEAA
jgi:hypothetical protein